MNRDHDAPLVVEPQRDVVEITEPGGGTLVVAEPVPVYDGDAPVDTTGAVTGDALVADPGGVLRPRRLTLADIDDVDAPPAAVGALVRAVPGGDVEPRALSHRHEQALPMQVWIVAHDLPFTPAAVTVRGEVGQTIWPAEVTHVTGRTRIEFSRPTAGTVELS